jgi:hypothetical protein
VLDGYHTASGAFVASFACAGVLLGTGIAVFLTAPKASGRAGGAGRRAAFGAFLAPRLGAGYMGFEGGF